MRATFLALALGAIVGCGRAAAGAVTPVSPAPPLLLDCPVTDPIPLGGAAAAFPVARVPPHAAASASGTCDAIGAPDEVPTREFRTAVRGIACHSACLPALGDATGMLAFPQEHHDAGCHGSTMDFVTREGERLGEAAEPELGMSLVTLQQPGGVVAVSRSYLGPDPRPAGVVEWDAIGRPTGTTWVVAMPRDPTNPRVYGPDPSWSEAWAPDPGCGALLAGDVAVAPAAVPAHAAVMLGSAATGPAVRWGPVPLGSDGSVLGAGVDVMGRALVLTDGAARYGRGHVAAQWLDRDGTPLTCAFDLLSGYAATADRAWLEATPLIGGGLAVVRVDLGQQGTARERLHRQAVAVVASGLPSFAPPPDWMAARPDTTLRIVRSGRAYAVLPVPAAVRRCSQRVELLAPDGTSCGAREYELAKGACLTRAITVAADGTVIQQLPASLEEEHPDAGNTCTWRWWARAVK